MRAHRSLVALLLTAGILAGCSTSSTTSSPTTSSEGSSLVGTAWQLESYRDAGGASVTAVAEPVAALSFDTTTRLGGSTGCNTFSGTYTSHEGQLSIRLGPTTLMACSGALGAQDASVTSLLSRVRGVQQTSRSLALTDAGNQALLTYRPGVASLPGTSWKATAVNNGRGGLEANALTEAVTAAFGQSSAFTSFAGCNHVSGSYATTGTEGLQLTGLVSTQMACGAEVDALEGTYVEALGKVTTYQIHGSTLTLRDSSGAAQVTYRLVG